MKRLAVGMACLLGLSGVQRIHAQAPAPPPLVLTHVTVIALTGSAPQPEMNVVIANGQIVSVDKSTRFPPAAQIKDASSKYLIPGLWDMHTHPSDKGALGLYLANGITGVRIMWGAPYHHQWSKEIETGALLGPRLVIASQFVDGPHPVHPGLSIVVSSAAEGREAVSIAKREGADFIKIYSLVPQAAYFALAGEANKQRMVFAGHVPRSITPAEASDAGQKSIEHLSGIAFECSDLEPQYQHDLQQLETELAVVGAPGNYYRLLRGLEGKYLAAYNPRK